jgi:hypothetical protein
MFACYLLPCLSYVKHSVVTVSCRWMAHDDNVTRIMLSIINISIRSTPWNNHFRTYDNGCGDTLHIPFDYSDDADDKGWGDILHSTCGYFDDTLYTDGIYRGLIRWYLLQARCLQWCMIQWYACITVCAIHVVLIPRKLSQCNEQTQSYNINLMP